MYVYVYIYMSTFPQYVYMHIHSTYVHTYIRMCDAYIDIHQVMMFGTPWRWTGRAGGVSHLQVLNTSVTVYTLHPHCVQSISQLRFTRNVLGAARNKGRFSRMRGLQVVLWSTIYYIIFYIICI